MTVMRVRVICYLGMVCTVQGFGCGTLTCTDTTASGKENTAIGYKTSATVFYGNGLRLHCLSSVLHSDGCFGGGHGIRVACCQWQRARQERAMVGRRAVPRGACQN